MCKFYSAIVMKNGDVLHNENLLSHEDLIRLFNINDSQVNCDKFVRVEFCPDDNNDLPDISKYNLKVDESTIPKWFEKQREFVESKLRDIVKNRIITSDLKILTGGLYVIKDCHVDKIISAQVVYMQNSSVQEMRENSSVQEMRGNSSVQEMRENSSVQEMWGNSSVQEMRENSNVQEMWGNSSVQVMRGNSSVRKMWGNSSVQVMRGNSSVRKMWGNSSVQVMRENSSVKENNSKNNLPSK